MIEIEHNCDGYLVCRASGTLSQADYDAAVPELENALRLRKAPLRMMIVLEDFRGWEIGALWKDLRFDVKHGDDFGRIAVVGESKLEEWGTYLSEPFSGANMRYFDQADRGDARAWLMDKPSAEPSNAASAN